MNYALYLREKITSLRLERNISEYQLSTELGKCKTYIQAISSGKSLPSFDAFFDLCEYFELTPAEFFTASAPTKQQRHIQHNLSRLSPEDTALLVQVLDRLLEHAKEETSE